MTHILYVDEDGDYVPCSVQRWLHAAKCWDAWKLVKHKGVVKAKSVVQRFWQNT